MFSRNALRATPISPEQTPFKGKVTQETPFYGGGVERKTLLQMTIGGVATSFVEREYTSYYVEAWQAFQEAGLPVAPTLHRNSRNTLLVTDVKADGSDVYGKSFFHSVNRPSAQFRRSPEADAHFIELMVNQKEEIHQAAIHLAAVAAHHAIRLPCDDALDLRVQPNGEWSLITLDLEGAVVPANLTTGTERFINDPLDPARFHEQNLSYVQNWQSDLHYAREALMRQAQ